ncbi:MAG TPA: HD domain-containing protein [Candidatus Bathyarchaeia archaeon]|nr:HD domain-containing protein [Candidatus Bathyarchaeia archaeon]
MINEIQAWFQNYTASFNTNNPRDNRNFELKFEHCLRVSDIAGDIAFHEGFSKHDYQLSRVIGLLHDIGRFEQYRQFQTFADHKSIDHGQLGVTVLQNASMLKVMNQDEQELIIKSISHHNRAALPTDESDQTLMFIKLIRDADKLDIFDLSYAYFKTRTEENKNTTLELHVHSGDTVSDKIFEQIMDGSLARMEDIETLNDFKTLQMGWIFDINFRRTYELIAAHQALEKLRSTIPDGNARVDMIYKKTRSFLNKKLLSGSRPSAVLPVA